MKKFVNELAPKQKKIYDYITSNVTDDGSDLIGLLEEVSEYYEAVPEHICEYYTELKEIEKIEVIHFVTRYILRKN
ncbi:hypothetical protein EEL30_21865 [Brevibacillus laterosporus]|uniref:Uncharacterized protein n=1 Tax=Brevibacillus laterosporus TaxID=1465 RepID=A0A518VCH0_BRELA|nr:hypothetical protein EEL30_21865 [Brevibacillus laterosporus]